MIEIANRLFNRIKPCMPLHISLGKSVSKAAPGTLILFPDHPNTFNCGISALVAFKPAGQEQVFNLDKIVEMIDYTAKYPLTGKSSAEKYLGGPDHLDQLFCECQALKTEDLFARLFFDNSLISELDTAAAHLDQIINEQKEIFKDQSAGLSSQVVNKAAEAIEKLQDIGWCLKKRNS